MVGSGNLISSLNTAIAYWSLSMMAQHSCMSLRNVAAGSDRPERPTPY